MFRIQMGKQFFFWEGRGDWDGYLYIIEYYFYLFKREIGRDNFNPLRGFAVTEKRKAGLGSCVGWDEGGYNFCYIFTLAHPKPNIFSNSIETTLNTKYYPRRFFYRRLDLLMLTG